jgi:glycosyltransferase involved in cell wall biosynthesis
MSELTICIPSYQRSASLLRLLGSIEKAAHADGVTERIDIVVALDGCSDDSAIRLETWRTRSAIKLTWRNHPHAGLATTRNRAVADSTGELVLLCDDDNLIEPGCLNAHLHHDRGVAAVLMGPSVMPGSSDGDITKRWYDERHLRLNEVGFVTDPGDFSAAATSAPRALWEEFRFDEEYSEYGFEDYDLAARLLATGVSIGFDLSAGVTHLHRPNDAERLRQKRGEGSNAIRFARSHPALRDHALGTNTSRFHRVMRRAAVPVMAHPLWWAANVLTRSRRFIPQRWRLRMWIRSQELARYSGVAAAGGLAAVDGS